MFDPKPYIRTVSNWPKEGVQFRDITTLLSDKKVFRQLIDAFVHHYMDIEFDSVVGVDARGFILGAPIAYELNKGFIPVRKKGKLPWKTIEQNYELEYGSDCVQIHTDMVEPGEKILMVDDLLATGGTAKASIQLIEKAGGEIVGCSFVIDLPDLGGSRQLKDAGYNVSSLMEFEGD